MKTEGINHLRWMHDRFIHVYGENQDVDFLIKLRSIIAELEALQQPKSCDGCRSKSCSVKRILLELGEINSSYFYCNDYEPKEVCNVEKII